MASELIAELHDVGKLVDAIAIEAVVRAETGRPFRLHDRDFCSHCFRRNLEQFGFTPPPMSLLWRSILFHLRRGIWQWDMNQWAQLPPLLQDCSPEDLCSLLMVMLADQIASSVSRVLEREDSADYDEDSVQQVAVLWRDRAAQGGRALPIATKDSLQRLFNFLGDRPTWDGLLARYGDALRRIPEDKTISRAVTTLHTHMELTGKCHRVLNKFVRPVVHEGRPIPFGGLGYGDNAAVTRLTDAQSRWRFRIARCTVRIPAASEQFGLPTAPARFRDLGVFARLETTLDALEADPERRDHVLLRTFEAVWLLLPQEEQCPLAEVVRPLLDAGFHIQATVREAPLNTLTAWGATGNDAEESIIYLQPDLPETISPPLCEVCQLAPGREYHERPEEPAEYLCGRCADTRRTYAQRFSRLGSWADGDTVAWLRVSLDFGLLERHLRDLFRRYVQEREGSQVDEQLREELVSNLRTTALTVDYVNDFLAMQDELARQLQAVFREENVETLAAERKELMVVRLARRGDVFRLLQVCDTVARRSFPRSIARPPFRVAVSLGPVRFPFGEHWRRLQQAKAELTVTLAGGGQLVCGLEAVPGLVALSGERGRARGGLYRLAELAAASPALARVALHAQEERELAGTARQLSDLGLDFESMATFARLTAE